MAKPLSENARTILAYLKDHYGEELDYIQISEATGIGPKSVNSIVTSALQKRELAERVVVEGREKKIINLTEKGLTYDPDAVEAETEVEG